MKKLFYLVGALLFIYSVFVAGFFTTRAVMAQTVPESPDGTGGWYVSYGHVRAVYSDAANYRWYVIIETPDSQVLRIPIQGQLPPEAWAGEYVRFEFGGKSYAGSPYFTAYKISHLSEPSVSVPHAAPPQCSEQPVLLPQRRVKTIHRRPASHSFWFR